MHLNVHPVAPLVNEHVAVNFLQLSLMNDTNHDANRFHALEILSELGSILEDRQLLPLQQAHLTPQVKARAYRREIDRQKAISTPPVDLSCLFSRRASVPLFLLQLHTLSLCHYLRSVRLMLL